MKSHYKEIYEKQNKSTNLTIFLMKCIGMWYVSNKKEKLYSDLILIVVLAGMLVAVIVQCNEIYHSKGDLRLLAYIAPCSSAVFTEFIKLLIFSYNRKKVRNLNKIIDNGCWKIIYNREETIIFNQCDETCFKAIILYFLSIQGICWHYVLAPHFEARSNNVTERMFPFPIYLDLPLTETPIYEILLILEIISTFHVALCTITFAIFLFANNMFTAMQFKILNVHLQSLCDFDENNNNVLLQINAHTKLKDCIRKHQMLIKYTNEVENLYCYAMLGQIFGSVTQICFSGFQIILSKTYKVPFQRTVLSVEYVVGSFLQLYFYCYSSHEIFIQSEKISESIYLSKWFKIVHSKIHKDFSLLLQTVVLRARRPCILTVGKFAPLTLDTFSAVLRTSLSYFTVLRQTVK